MKLSIIIPAFNEENTVLETLKEVEAIDLGDIEKEIIIIDDGSTDGTQEILRTLEQKYKIIYHQKNQGKGMAIRNGFTQATGDIILIQDADLECNPQNYPLLIQPILEGKADVVFGSRFKNKKFFHFLIWFQLGNKILTWFSNLLTGLNLTDIWTGYKVFRKEVIRVILPHLTAKRFEIEPELITWVAKKKYRVLEVNLHFLGKSRTYSEGKKINWRDGLVAVYYIIKFNLFK